MTDLPLTDKALLTWGNADLDCRMYVTAALRAALPATSAAPELILDLARHGHWCIPMLRILYWLQHSISPVDAMAEAEALRVTYAEHLASIRASSAERQRYALAGKASAAERKATTDALFASLKL